MSNALIDQMAEEDFSKARHFALINEIKNFMNKTDARLLSLAEAKKLFKPKNEVYKGMQVVQISDIVGSEGRYLDFDSKFFPKKDHLRTRWENVDKAHLTDVILPPITLYEIAGLYFVRDGNHRVSVARMQGVENIDAEVISLKSEIKIAPGSNRSEILKQVIDYEKRVFYSETNFGDITDYWDIDFSTPGQYDVIYQHILIHKYYINEPIDYEIPIEEAIKSWFENVYMPVITNIRTKKLMPYFKGRTESDMYVWIIKYWDDLKRQYGQGFELEKAVTSFSQTFRTTPLTRLQNFLKKILKTKK